MTRFSGKSVVITGGSSGIGLAAALRIAAEGGQVLITGANPERLKAVKDAHPELNVLQNDARDPEAASVLAETAKQLFGGKIDGAFLNAGAGAGAMLGGVTPELYRDQVDLNIGGPLFGVQALAPLMADGGSIVITASIAKDKGMPGSALYSATKGAVRALVRGFARELAPRQIRVNTVSPGPIETDFFVRLGMPAEQLAYVNESMAQSNPMGRMGRPEEAAAVALFLLSDDASYVTGSDYFVDGGAAQL